MKGLDSRLKKIIIFFSIGIVAIILLCYLIYLVRDKALTYEGIENKMISASKSYFSKHKSKLPQENNEEVEISASILAEEGYMKNITKYQKSKSVTCTGKVNVIKSGDYYYYSPYLNCGDKYTTAYFSDKLLDNVVNDGDGLYLSEQYYDGNVEKAYIYKGEYVKNYIAFGNNKELWRIVKINPDRTIMIIQAEPNNKVYSKVTWDNRYNIDIGSNVGINNFEESRIRRRLLSYYNNEDYFNDDLKEKLVSKKVCIGGRHIKDSKNDGSIECKKMSDTEVFFSLLPAYDFLNASLDKNCKLIEDKSCSNYNYLNRYGESFWLLTTNSANNYRGYLAYSYIRRETLSTNAYPRAVAYLNQDVIYSSGIGSYSDPFIIK